MVVCSVCDVGGGFVLFCLRATAFIVEQAEEIGTCRVAGKLIHVKGAVVVLRLRATAFIVEQAEELRMGSESSKHLHVRCVFRVVLL